MIHLLILILLAVATYVFHNYQAFNDAYLRPWVVEQVNYNREANPQALCDLLAPDATLIIGDKYTRYRYHIENGSKTEVCNYLEESARHFQKPYSEANGYIWDHLSEYRVDQENWFKDYADVTFSTEVKMSGGSRDLVTTEGDIMLGKTTTKMTVKIEIFKDPKITRYEFHRRLTQMPTD